MHPSPIEFLQHIQAELAYILKYSQGVTYEEFLAHPFLSKAFIRSFEIIGEACKNVPDEMWDAIQQDISPNKEWIDIILEQELNKLS